MKETRRLSLQEETKKEAQRIQREIKTHPKLEKMMVSEKLEEELLEKIRAYEKEEAEKEKAGSEAEFSEELVPEIPDVGKTARKKQFTGAISIRKTIEHTGAEREEEELFMDTAEAERTEKGSRTGTDSVLYYKRRRRLALFVLAAALICVLGAGMTSIGSKSYMKVFLERLQWKEPLDVINVEDMNEKESEDIDELAVYREIDEKLGISAIRVIYKPWDMRLINYTLDEELQQAKLFYEYGDEVIRYIIYINEEDSSIGEKKEDIKIGEYTVFVNDIKIIVEELQVENSELCRQVANFQYKNVRYQLNGIMKQEEFKNIIEKLYFID